MATRIIFYAIVAAIVGFLGFTAYTALDNLQHKVVSALTLPQQ